MVTRTDLLIELQLRVPFAGGRKYDLGLRSPEFVARKLSDDQLRKCLDVEDAARWACDLASDEPPRQGNC